MPEAWETAAQRKFLTEAGCGALQGYLPGKPIPAAAFPGWERIREVVPEEVPEAVA